MKRTHALPLLLSTLTVLSFAGQQRSQRTRGTAKAKPQETVQEESGETTRGFPGTGETASTDVFGRRKSATEARSPQELLVGGWQLKSFKLRKGPTSTTGVRGLLVISESFLSLELHGSGDPTSRTNGLAFHMSLGGEYVMKADGQLTLQTMIGSYQDSDSDGLAWERAGQPREFKAVFTERQLLLSWGGNTNQLTFNRRTPQMTGRTDIFGRKVQPTEGSPSLDTDIFGRSIPGEDAGGGATDIFGRRIPGSKKEQTPPKRDDSRSNSRRR